MCKSGSFDRLLSFTKARQVKITDHASSKCEVDELRTQAVVLVVFNLEREVFLRFQGLAVVDELLGRVYCANVFTF